jgi:RNA binding exosome subunit
VRKPFAVLHARTFCHATEDLERVRSALENAVGKSEINISKTEGHHGNPIVILEAAVEGMDGIDRFFSKLSRIDVGELLSSLSSRIDDSCNLFVRIDKQAAFKDEIRLGRDDDVISVRVRVRSFPAKREAAYMIAKEYLEGVLAGTGAQ